MKIGKKIRYLNQEGTATIKELRQKTAIVEDENGFDLELDLREILPLENKISESLIEVPESYLKEKEPSVNFKKKTLSKLKEVDLHFGQLVDFPENFSPKEKLQIQIRTAKEEIEKNRGKVEKLILIHGKGKGVLEKEINDLLMNTQGIRYKDAPFNRYKLGAVEIRFI